MDTTQILPHPSVKDELWAHQRAAVERSRNLDYYALFFEPGTGKTGTAIHWARHKYNTHHKILPTLILCPPVVISNWKSEWAKFSKVDPKRVIPLVGTGKERLEILKNSPMDSIFITNYESLLMKDLYAYMRVVFGSGPSLLIGDEIHKCKDATSKRTKALMDLAPLFKYRIVLTGTPILNSLMDLFSQFKILDLGKRFGKNFYSFRATFFEDKNKAMPSQKYFPDWRPQREADSKIRNLIADCSMFAAKADCLDLPPLVRKVIEVPMGKEQKRLYESMKRDLIATVMGDDGKLRASIAELAITKALRLQQIVSGHLRVEDEDGGGATKTLKILDNPRKDALMQILEDVTPSHKVLVWAVFKDNYEDIRDVCNKLKIKYAEIHGEIKDKQATITALENDPEIRVVIGHPGSGGIGVNLTAASYSVFYSRNFSLEQDLQAEARNHRGGSERHESLTRIDLVTPSTIDELVLKSLANKQVLGDKILRAHLEEI